MAYTNETGLPSVTNILKPWVDTRWFTKESAERGNQVHDRCESYLTRSFPTHFEDQYEPYWQSFKKFEPNIGEVVLVEERLADHDLGFCGQPDLVCVYVDGLVTLVDWKTAQATYKYWPLQLGGYSILLKTQKNIQVEKMMTVRLRNEYSKKPLINVYCVSEFELMFANQLKIYKHFN
ncbi:MAG: hypothetical protein HKO79_00780 [Desulfobacterales bacterium]|nr:hypothetical protein [Desulfobacterales bacterium]